MSPASSPVPTLSDLSVGPFDADGVRAGAGLLHRRRPIRSGDHDEAVVRQPIEHEKDDKGNKREFNGPAGSLAHGVGSQEVWSATGKDTVSINIDRDLGF
jgi:hypothetical protein